jgi:hypothetical protein
MSVMAIKVNMGNKKTGRIQTFEVNSNVNFHLQNLVGEVRKNPKKAKKMIVMLSSTQTTFVSWLSLVSPTMAATKDNFTEELPSLIFEIVVIVGLIGLGIAVITLMLSSVWKMLFGKGKSDEWTTEILKGLAQLILSPILVTLIVGLCVFLFGDIPAFYGIKKSITTFWGN